MKLLKDLTYGVNILELKGSTNIAIDHVAFDSRKVLKFSLFIAIRGTQVDGHQYIQKAVQSGAVCIVCEKLPENIKEDVTYIVVKNTAKALGLIASNYFDNPSEKIKLIGVTGLSLIHI